MDDHRTANSDVARPPMAEADDCGRKRPYSRPTLTDYGTVADLTRGSGGTSPDGHSGKKQVLA